MVDPRPVIRKPDLCRALPVQLQDASAFEYYGNVVGCLPLDPLLEIAVEPVIAVDVTVAGPAEAAV